MADASYIDTPESSSSIASTLQENLGNFETFNLTDSKSDYFLNQRLFNKSNAVKRGLYSYRPLHDHNSCHLTNNVVKRGLYSYRQRYASSQWSKCNVDFTIF